MICCFSKIETAKRCAFTLIEMVGVLAVIAVLAAVLLPALIKETDKIVSDQETATLQSYANAVQNYVQLNRRIETNWIVAIAAVTGAATNDVAVNSRRQARVFVINGVPGGGPYVQNSGGTSPCPTNARMMILSALGAVGIPLNSGPLIDSDFNSAWNAAVGSVPASGAWAGWKGNPQDIIIQRINFGPLFFHLVLNNTDLTNAPYSIDNFPTNSLPPNVPPLDAYFIGGTGFKLYLVNTNPEASQVLAQDSSWVFSGGAWRNAQVPAAGTGGGGLSSIVQTFINNRANPSGYSPLTLFSDMTNWLANYNLWASTGFTNTYLQNTVLKNLNATFKTDLNNLDN